MSRDRREMKAARTVAAFAADRVVGRLGPGPIPHGPAHCRVTFQALVGAVKLVECFPQKLPDGLRVGRLILGPDPTRPVRALMIREPQHSDPRLLIVANHRKIAVA